MTAKELAIQAFETCEHAGMICMDCAERAIKTAIEQERIRWLCDGREHDGDQELLWEGLPTSFTFSA
ncbi:MAG TPA: hypothetical protein VFM04_10000 [Candidatus Methylomirabilis sp.]|nr:hypothetical protein [Candidatus Methylomirabilis sp.]